METNIKIIAQITVITVENCGNIEKVISQGVPLTVSIEKLEGGSIWLTFDYKNRTIDNPI